MQFLRFSILALFSCALAACSGAGKTTIPKPACSWDGQSTVIKDAEEAKLLYDPTFLSNQLDGTISRGLHALGRGDLLTNSNPSPGYRPGFVLFSKRGSDVPGCPSDLYRVMGWNEEPWDKRGSVQSLNVGTISGIITEIRSQEFDFEGTISGTYGDKFLQTGDYVFTNGFYQLHGIYTFSRKNHPAYWSLISIPEHDGNAQDYLPPLDIMTISPAKTLLEEYQKDMANGTL